ncbi:ribbon-helix-helix protein, CopG family [Geobacter sp. SVR]|uniref:ribbon-helix-helix protein, CopG family n=1 Tax=Geobacter sp. SVR TaxID=2495594 RepID=UPI00143EFB22|nr:ribbon-helix-helix protein, CopG family [Geobacter sp. SVR]BCS52792.1 CopG family transcriptional regulator [Geobacter sp. SVR]GCF86658.1 CopG family transcriptional regulator [Geobacter sp. SVR]
MRYIGKQLKQETRKRRLPEKTLDNVISLRISDQEKRKLERVVKKTSKNMSDIMREAINLWINKRDRLCLD